MSKSIVLALAFICLVSALTDAPHNYESQGSLPLIPNITNLGYSPDQKHLIVLASQGIPPNAFVHFYGLRLDQKQTITINDPGAVTPSVFAFSPNGDWLIIGSNSGSIYGYPLQDGKLLDFKYKTTILNGEITEGIKSISFSPSGKIAVAAKDFLKIFAPLGNPDKTEFEQLTDHQFEDILSSVAWKHTSEDIVIVGGDRQKPFFHIVDVSKPKPLDPVAIETTLQTFSIGVFPDNDGTIIQGVFEQDIKVYQWDETLTPPNYKKITTIPGSVSAKEISITKKGDYFAAQSDGKVQAWKSALQFKTVSNLKNQPPQSITPENILTQNGKNLALSNDGNRILVIGDTQTASKFSICNYNQWYDGSNTDCKPCENNCGECFSPDQCNTCTDKTRYVDDSNQCQPCTGVRNGCQQCTSATACTLCNTDEFFNPIPDPTDNTCKCIATHFLDGTQCKNCDVISFCLECNSAKQCTTCVEKDHIKKDAVDGACVCEAGWYLDGVCKDCSLQAGCKECKSATNCTLCDHIAFWTEDLATGKCICQPGYWQDGTTCVPCGTKTSNCTACKQDGTCTKCVDTRVPINGQCECEGHRYEDATKQCQLCDDKLKCLHCDPTGTHTCTECDYIDGHRKKLPVNGNCVCQPGYTQNEQEVCTQCFIDGCEQCDTLDQCSLCFEEKNFNPRPDPDQKICVCKDGFLPMKDKQSCSSCGKQIPGCTTCQDLQVCQACDGKNNFLPQPNALHKCSCVETYFLNDALCELCSQEYKNCHTCNEAECLQCQAGYLISDDKKKCFTCAQVIPGCKTCTDLKVCTECNAEKFWQVAIDGKTCDCKVGYYKNATECKLCSAQYPFCSKCNIEGGCSVCQETFTFNPQKKECFCADDKEIKDGKCEDQSGLSALAIIAIIVGILAVAGAAVAIIKCFKKRQSPLEDGEYEALEGEKQ